MEQVQIEPLKHKLTMQEMENHLLKKKNLEIQLNGLAIFLVYPELPAVAGFVAKKCAKELENEKRTELMEQIHNLNISEKRILRICQNLDIESTSFTQVCPTKSD